LRGTGEAGPLRRRAHVNGVGTGLSLVGFAQEANGAVGRRARTHKEPGHLRGIVVQRLGELRIIDAEFSGAAVRSDTDFCQAYLAAADPGDSAGDTILDGTLQASDSKVTEQGIGLVVLRVKALLLVEKGNQAGAVSVETVTLTLVPASACSKFRVTPSMASLTVLELFTRVRLSTFRIAS
jgi:hypothetical protein